MSCQLADRSQVGQSFVGDRGGAQHSGGAPLTSGLLTRARLEPHEPDAQPCQQWEQDKDQTKCDQGRSTVIRPAAHCELSRSPSGLMKTRSESEHATCSPELGSDSTQLYGNRRIQNPALDSRTLIVSVGEIPQMSVRRGGSSRPILNPQALTRPQNLQILIRPDFVAARRVTNNVFGINPTKVDH